MTNMLNVIDKAILRRGRFDHIIEVTMPSSDEVEALLKSLFDIINTAFRSNYNIINIKIK